MNKENLSIKKVLIIGSPGSGKSTFAIKLSEITNLPLYHLDYFRHDKNSTYKNNPVQWTRFLNKICSNDSWIIDGNYTNSLELRIKRADTIIFFDYPKRISLHRVFKRRVNFIYKKRSDMPDLWNEKLKLKFIKFVWNFNKIQRPTIYRILDQYKHDRNLLIFKRPSEAKRWLNNLTFR
jgi:adenylate kinase family enzyme